MMVSDKSLIAFSVLGMPLGIAVNFVINGRHLLIPMVTEEPSVIAACNGAAKTIAMADHQRGFMASCSSSRKVSEGQILLDLVKQPQVEVMEKVSQSVSQSYRPCMKSCIDDA